MGGVSLTGGAALSRPLTVRKPNADELHQLHQWLEQPLKSWQPRRAEVLLLYAADGSASAIAQLLQVHRNTVSSDLRAFARHGLSAPSRPRKLGAPPRLSKKQIAAIWRLADREPTTLGLPFGRWSLAKLRAYLIRERIVSAISREHLRRVLKKGGTRFATSSASSSAPIPIGV
jgi:transposase